MEIRREALALWCPNCLLEVDCAIKVVSSSTFEGLLSPAERRRPTNRFFYLGVQRTMIRAICLSALLLVDCILTSASAQELERPGQEAFIKRAVFAQQRLWLLSDSGALSSIVDRGDERIVEHLPEPVLDVCVQNGDPLIVTGQQRRGTVWTMRRWRAGEWQPELTISRSTDMLLALSCLRTHATLLTSNRLIDVVAGVPKVTSLRKPVKGGAIASVHDLGDHFFVGFNAGEWGGGLIRIDRRRGTISRIESNLSGDLCGGPLNTDCDPVNGINVEPWNSSCVVVAIGLVHFLSHGRIAEVCGNTVKRLYFRPYEIDSRLGIDTGVMRDQDEPISTVAFFGIERVGDALWAVGIDGLYRITQSGTSEPVPLPVFKNTDGVNVSFDIPGLVLVVTQVNQRRSVSGAVPMLVPR